MVTISPVSLLNAFRNVQVSIASEPTSDGTGDPKRARCPIIGSCIIFLPTLRFGDLLSWATDFGSGSVDLSDLDLWIKQT